MTHKHDLPKCEKCGREYCPENSVDENGDWDGSSKQNCSCKIPLSEIERQTIPPEIIDRIKRELLYKLVMDYAEQQICHSDNLEKVILAVEDVLEWVCW